MAVIGEALSHEHRSLTWLWSLNGRTSGPSFYAGDTSSFTLDYSNVVGMDSKEYEPVILQLRPTTNNMRIVSAAKGWTSALRTRENSWDINRTLIEDRVPCKVNAAKTGIASVVAGPLPPGEYAVALCPVKDKKVAGMDMVTAETEGSAWQRVCRSP